MTPDVLRRLLWTPPADLSEAGIAAGTDRAWRPTWQVAIAAPIVARACADHQ